MKDGSSIQVHWYIMYGVIIKGSLDEKLPSYELLKMLKIQ